MHIIMPSAKYAVNDLMTAPPSSNMENIVVTIDIIVNPGTEAYVRMTGHRRAALLD